MMSFRSYDNVMSKRKPVSEEMHNFIIHQSTLGSNHENNTMADWLTQPYRQQLQPPVTFVSHCLSLLPTNTSPLTD